MTMLAQPPVQCANSKDHQRDSSRPIAIETERFQTFNRVTAIEQFFEHTGAHNNQCDKPDRQFGQRRTR